MKRFHKLAAAVSTAMMVALSATGASATTAFYDFNGDLSDTLGGGDIVAIGSPTVGASSFAFGPQDGFRLSGIGFTYAIEIGLTIDATGNSFGKIFDFRDRAQDIGLYARSSGDFNFATNVGSITGDFPGGGTGWTSGTPLTLGLTRNGLGDTEIFLNGVSIMFFDDATATAALGPAASLAFGGEISLFVDDFVTVNGSGIPVESLSGSVDYISVSDTTEFLDVDAIRNASAAPAPGGLGLTGLALGGIALAMRRRRTR